MVQISWWFHFTFKDLSNEYPHAQIRVKMKKLWPRQVGEEKQVAVRKVCRDQEVCHDQKVCRDQEVCRHQESMSRPGEYVTTRKVCRDQESMSQPENLVATKNASET